MSNGCSAFFPEFKEYRISIESVGCSTVRQISGGSMLRTQSRHLGK